MHRTLRSNTRFDLIILSSCIVLALAARALPNTMREPVATGMRRTFLAPLVMLQERAERGRQSLLQADAKQSRIDSLSLNSMKAGSLEGENDRLRKLIGLGSRLRWGFIPTEALHGRGVRDETTVILSAGSRAGVSRLSPVIAPEGLVGVVDQVDPTMSHAMLWTHPDFRVSAMSPDGTATPLSESNRDEVIAILATDDNVLIVRASGEVTGLDRSNLVEISRDQRCGRATASALLPYIAGHRLLLATDDSGINNVRPS